jgi:hypothetical protein
MQNLGLHGNASLLLINGSVFYGLQLAWQYQPASYCLFSTDCSLDYCDIVFNELPYYYLVLSRSIFLIAPLQGLRILSVNKFPVVYA